MEFGGITLALTGFANPVLAIERTLQAVLAIWQELLRSHDADLSA